MSEKKIAVVTGGARGIGKAIALELAKAGNLVVINYNGSEEKARETKAEIEAAGGQADILQCNGGSILMHVKSFSKLLQRNTDVLISW